MNEQTAGQTPNKYLIVVDMQKDFVSGSLGSPEAQAIVPAVRRKLEGFTGRVCVTQDTHGEDYLSTQEGQLLPVLHCIEGTPGWELTEELTGLPALQEARFYRKPTFACVELARDLAAAHREEPITEIEVVGLCTDICVVSNALMIKGFLPDVPMYVDAACCAGVSPQRHEAALQTMESCQVTVRRPEQACFS